MPRKKRNLLLLLLFVVTVLVAIAYYVANKEVVPWASTKLPSTSSSKSQTLLFSDRRHRVVHAIDHGCFLQTSNFTHHRHSPRRLSDRSCEQRLPMTLVIGGALCGTQTFTSALSFHPDVVVPEADSPRFAEMELKDKDRFRASMPFSQPNQLTVDESQEYLYIPNCSKGFADVVGPNLKVIVLLRDPVARAMSEYVVLTSSSRDEYYQQSLAHKQCFPKKENRTIIASPGEFVELADKKTKSKRHVKKLTRRDKRQRRERQKEQTRRKTKHDREKRRAEDKKRENPKGSPSDPYKGEEINYDINLTFEKTVLGADSKIKGGSFLLQRSIYVPGLKKWRKTVVAENMLILDADEFARNPAHILKVTEKFLGLEPYFQPEFFDFDLPGGRLCFNSPVRSCVNPLVVQQTPRELADSLVSELREFFIPWIKVQNRITRVYFPHLGEYPLIFTPFR